VPAGLSRVQEHRPDDLREQDREPSEVTGTSYGRHPGGRTAEVSSLPLWAYPGVFVASLLLSALLVPVAMSVAVRFGFLDHPGPAKSHTEAVPYLGGAAIVVAFAAVVLVGVLVDPPPSESVQLSVFLGLGVVLAVVGVIDDLSGGVSPLLRLALEVAAATAVWSLGSSAHLAGAPRPLDAVISVLWIVGVTNAFNLLDNMDGLSAGTATIAGLAIFGVAALQHRYLVAALAIALAGCAAGFLRSNFHPAKIYMGDAGSLFLGFVLAVLLLKLRGDAPTRVPVAVILAIPGLALFDTSLVVVTRLAHRVSPFQGGKDHTSHRLVHLGLSVPVAVGILYAVDASLAGAAIVMSQLGDTVRIVGVVALVGGGLLAAVPLCRVPVYLAKRSPAERSPAVLAKAAGLPANGLPSHPLPVTAQRGQTPAPLRTTAAEQPEALHWPTVQPATDDARWPT
jgi:UDP-GlcNAc:undecaprenyl-phosphate GlcNAc-1-phosphate transferase